MNYAVMESQLSGDYRALFAKVTAYAMTDNFHSDYADERIADLYEMLVTAQQQNTPVERIAGKDAERFCKDLFSDYTLKERFIGFLDNLYGIAWFVLIIELITVFANDDPLKNFFSIKTDISGYGFGVVIGAILTVISKAVYRPAILRSKKVSSGKWAFAILGTFIALFVLLMVLFGDKEIMLPVYPLILCSAAYMIMFASVRAVLRYKKYGTVRNVKRMLYKDSYYRDLQDKDLEKTVMKVWLKRYERLLKKGKTTEESFVEKIRKDEKINCICDLGLLVFYIIMMASFIIGVAKDSTAIDTMIFAVLLIAVELAIYHAFHRSYKKGSAMRMRIVSDSESAGMTLPAYLHSQLDADTNRQAQEQN